MREATGVIINPSSAPHRFVAKLLFVVSNVKFMLLVFICGELLVP